MKIDLSISNNITADVTINVTAHIHPCILRDIIQMFKTCITCPQIYFILKTSSTCPVVISSCNHRLHSVGAYPEAFRKLAEVQTEYVQDITKELKLL